MRHALHAPTHSLTCLSLIPPPPISLPGARSRTVADVEQVVQEASRHAVARFVSQRPADGESASEAEAPGIGEADLLGVATNASD